MRYSSQFIYEIVKQYKVLRKYSAVARIYCINRKTVRRWVEQFCGMSITEIERKRHHDRESPPHEIKEKPENPCKTENIMERKTTIDCVAMRKTLFGRIKPVKSLVLEISLNSTINILGKHDICGRSYIRFHLDGKEFFAKLCASNLNSLDFFIKKSKR